MRTDKPTTPVCYRFKRAASHSDRAQRPTLNRAAFTSFLAAADAALACTELENELRSATWTTGRDY